MLARRETWEIEKRTYSQAFSQDFSEIFCFFTYVWKMHTQVILLAQLEFCSEITPISFPEDIGDD